jgi:hypothetical protein
MKHPIRPALLAGAALAACLAAPAAAQVDSAFAVSYGGTTLFRINSDAGAYFAGTYNTSWTNGPAITGSGTRLLWYPEKAAIRAGTINGTQWDDANIGLGSVAMGYDVRASGDNSTAFGIRATAAQISSFAVGEDVTASGAASVAMGYHAHTNARQGSFVFADRSSVDTLRAGVNHSANWRVTGGFRIFTNTTLTSGVTIQSGSVASNWCSGQTNAVISTSTCAYLSTGGVWTNNSDVNRKHGFAHVDGEDVLLRLRGVPVTTWTYNDEPNGVRHLGPTAQDFYRAFGLGLSPTSIPTVDADGVALAGVKALDARTQAQQARIDALERENAELRARLDRLEAALAAQHKP